MSQHTDWTVEPRGRGWLARLIAPQEGDRSSSVPLFLGALGALSFVGSLALDWQRVSVTPPSGEGQQLETAVFSAGVGDFATLSLAYILGGMALLTIAGAVVMRSDLALRFRMSAMGAGIGVLGVVVAITLRLSNAFLGSQGLLETVFFGFGQPLSERMTTAYEPGILFGYAAVVLPLLAIWLAGRPAARSVGRRLALADEEAEPTVAVDAGRPAETVVHRVPRPDGPLDLTVTSEGPVHPH